MLSLIEALFELLMWSGIIIGFFIGGGIGWIVSMIIWQKLNGLLIAILSITCSFVFNSFSDRDNKPKK